MSRLQRLTTEPEIVQAEESIAQARQALSGGVRVEARRWIWVALASDPHSVRAWLMLAALASPRASLGYAMRAVELRPHDPIAHAALRWARQRLADTATMIDRPPAPARLTAGSIAPTLPHIAPVPLLQAGAPAAVPATSE